MKRATHIARRCLFIGALGGIAALGACTDTATTAPRRLQPAAPTAHDDGPPDTPCRSGWVVVNGVWVCSDP